MTRPKDQAPALARLAVYRERREALHADVREALAEGATQADVARASGITRQWVARIAALTSAPQGASVGAPTA